MIVRPYGVVLRGRLELGLELLMYGSDVVEIRPHTGIPEPYVVSPAFVNAHSHFEYLGLQNEIQAEEYWPWIRELTQRKMDQTLPEVRSDCIRAAEENRAAGIAVVAEHSDRPFAGEAMARAGLSGVIFQEVITFFEREAREAKLSKVGDAALENRQFFPS
ncbi:MAG TPA: hypothetical protein VEX38_10720, partial [Fimbriimonadaceae bacterium]|nr:hypothetical protein [Fimbriimonadaceae bacterium]